MKVSREQASRNREKVVATASRLFRAHGVDGVGIGEVMRACDLTHGGFYNQFESKDALAAEACTAALTKSAAWWRAIAADAEDAAAAIADDYLSPRNRDAPETGCALIALGPDAARKGGGLARAFRQGLEELAGILAEHGGMDRQAALARLAQMVGTMVLARAVDDAALSDEILQAVRAEM
ncbi:TetR/AcrR family transcriptional regulator [Sphingobium sp. CCH11-B1]|uniref:TetR/AcrR family transcriptional regulator n=1 Tax=Sphingobium sp. CCH11-B1 TaxID=1768781 RepID=UPI00082DFB94|nr:TetR/AcrR family transcriptional regulator [Sphingobium sp. CCH11-B1]MEA3388835.1 TetR/AcrR family transcriptional regulator [Pseudomonadota bacterium]